MTSDDPGAELIDWSDFRRVDLRVGTILKVEEFPQARRPAYILHVDFGPEIGVKKSCAQITALYTLEELVGRRVVGVINFPPKQIGPIRSECLITGFPREDGAIVLAVPDLEVPNGTRLA